MGVRGKSESRDKVSRTDIQKMTTAESVCEVFPGENWPPPKSNLVTRVPRANPNVSIRFA